MEARGGIHMTQYFASMQQMTQLLTGQQLTTPCTPLHSGEMILACSVSLVQVQITTLRTVP